jgi:hypothetical protein
MGIYYHLDSTGEDTNLQLYAFHHSKRLWKALREDYSRFGDETADLKERCVLILAVLGLSISQLLGQNCSTIQSRLPGPAKIFKDFVDQHGLDPTLKPRFDDFIDFYDGCRHFGQTSDGSSHARIDDLSFDETKKCFDFGILIWTTVVGVFRGQNGNDLEEFDPTDDSFDDSE